MRIKIIPQFFTHLIFLKFSSLINQDLSGTRRTFVDFIIIILIVIFMILLFILSLPLNF